MPLPKRCVEPVLVSRGTVPERHNVPSELEAVTNGTLANTVRQLSSLSKHAEDMFGELTRDASALAERANGLQARIDRLAVRVTQLDSSVEEVSLQDIQMRKAFRSSRTFTQQIFSRNTIPSAMLVTYARCEPPPPLERLNEFRDDGKDARKFYTDPGYFFELWRHDMLQVTERIQHDRGKKVRQPRAGGAGGRAGGRVRAPHSTRERQRAAAVTRGEHLMPQPAQTPPHQYQPESHYRDPSVVDGGASQYRASQPPRPASQAQRPCSIELSEQPSRQPRFSTGNGHVMGEESPYGPGSEPIYGGSLAGTPRRARPSVPPPAPPAPLSPPTANHTPTRSALPPPPPPPEGAPPPLTNGAASPPPPPQPARTALDAHLDHMHRVMDMMRAEPEEAPPPPPPPPPPAPQPARPAPPSAAELLLGASTLRAAPLQPPPPVDPRNDLLKSIRDGIKLRKAERHERIQRSLVAPAPGLFDVAEILSRRVAFDLSDSEDESENLEDTWDDTDDGESRVME